MMLSSAFFPHGSRAAAAPNTALASVACGLIFKGGNGLCRIKLFEDYIVRNLGQDGIIVGDDNQTLFNVDKAALAIEESYTDRTREDTLGRVKRSIACMQRNGVRSIVVAKKDKGNNKVLLELTSIQSLLLKNFVVIAGIINLANLFLLGVDKTCYSKSLTSLCCHCRRQLCQPSWHPPPDQGIPQRTSAKDDQQLLHQREVCAVH